MAEVREVSISDEHMLIYSGDIKEHKHGAGMLLNKQMSKSYMAQVGYY